MGNPTSLSSVPCVVGVGFRGIQAVTPAEYGELLQMETPYIRGVVIERVAERGVDVMSMSKLMPEAVFRRYIELSRMWRQEISKRNGS